MTTTLPAGQSYLVTGAAGFIGQHLCRFLLDTVQPRRVIAFCHSEYPMAQMATHFPDPRMRWPLGDVRDQDRLGEVLGGVDVVIHAAALKRLDDIAYNPTEVTKTNVLGTKNVCMSAITMGVGKVVTISSDKAVQPTNMYGASKQMGEHITTGANVYGVPQGTRLACVRYGNVLGSRGSVVHMFREMAARGEPLRITHPEVTRFWITAQHACRLILTTLEQLEGGEIVLPKLPTMRLTQLAEAVAPGHPQTVVGLRPGGEKWHESMIAPEEAGRTLDRGDHYVITPNPHPWRAKGWSGTLVPEGFTYRSDNEDHTLSIPQMQALLRDVP